MIQKYDFLILLFMIPFIGIMDWIIFQRWTQCEKCGHRSPHLEVFRVFHVDGDLNNCRPANLKTVCCNCAQVLGKEGINWRQGDLTADY
jgi:hypothetical protein